MSAFESILQQLRQEDGRAAFFDFGLLPGSQHPDLHERQIAEHNAAWAQARQRRIQLHTQRVHERPRGRGGKKPDRTGAGRR